MSDTTIRMRALCSRTASQSPTGKPLARGDEYSADQQRARDDQARGFGERITAPAPAKKATA